MSNIKLKNHNWDTTGVYDSTLGKTQRQVNADLTANKVNTSDYAPATKTSEMTQSVGKDSSGKLWTTPVSSASIASATETWLANNITQETGYVIDESLSVKGAAADASACGDLKSSIDKTLLDEYSIIQRPYLGRTFVANNLTVNQKGLELEINGTITKDTLLFLDKDQIDYPWGNGLNTNFFRTYNPFHVIDVTPGHTYCAHLKMKSGTITKDGVSYTSEQDFGSVNVVRLWLMKSNAAASSDNYTSHIGGTFVINESQVGTLVFYCYNGITADNAVFEVWLEDVTLKKYKMSEKIAFAIDFIPNYWEEEINEGIARANAAIYGNGNSSSILFITDCHWSHNAQKSPAIAKKILNSCNINWFINGGDMLEAHTLSKETAETEIQDCINAFYGSRLPMFTVYGNHDRNRNSNTNYSDRLISFNEHHMLTNKSFNPNPYITYVADKTSYYWEDENYRYVALYWYDSENRTMTYIEELMNTNKPIIIICHGIYFVLADDPTEDVIDNGWILYNLEPYKSKIRCFIQGHTHLDGLRYAWNTVPIICCTCDRLYDETLGTNEEQALSVITVSSEKVIVTRIGRGSDFVVESNTPIFTR